MTPRDLRNIHTTGNSCRDALPCANMALKLRFPFKTYKVSTSSHLYICSHSPWNSPQQLAVLEGFAEANIVFMVITLAKILSRWLFRKKIYIQFIICNTYFLTKLSFTNKRDHLHMLEKCLFVLQEVRSIIYFWQFIHPVSLGSLGSGTFFALRYYIIVSAEFCNVTFLSNLYFVSFFYHLFICWRQRKNKTCDIKQKIFT